MVKKLFAGMACAGLLAFLISATWGSHNGSSGDVLAQQEARNRQHQAYFNEYQEKLNGAKRDELYRKAMEVYGLE